MVRKWRELSPYYSRATATAPLFFYLVSPRRALPFLVLASGVVALKVAQVPSTEVVILNIICCVTSTV